MADDGRDRGILSEADRNFLRGESDFSSEQAKRNARARIRDRIHEAIFDLELLVEQLSERDRRLVFEKRFGNKDGIEAFDALVAAVAFLYQGIEDTELQFEDVLTEGVNVAEAQNERAATVDLELTFRDLSSEQLLSKLKRGESLTLTELAYLQQSNDVRDDEIARYLTEGEETLSDGRIQSKVTQF